MSNIALTCELVREATSARLDNEEAGVARPEIDRHLAGCTSCGRFVAEATALLRKTELSGRLSVQPPSELLATVASTRATPAPLVTAQNLTRRLRAVVGSRRVPLVLASMALVLALPFASAGALNRLESGHAHARAKCSTLLLDRHRRP